MGGFGDFLFGSKGGIKKKQVYTPQQMGVLQNLLSSLMQGNGQGGQGGGQGGNFLDYYNQLLGGGEQSDFENFAAPFRQEFQDQTIPMLAERFAGGGGGMGGALSSSGFGQSLGAAGSQLQNQLAALYAGLRQHAAGQMAGLTGTALGAQPYALIQKQASPGFLPTLAGNAFSAFTGGF
jgi:hypothetical protein